MDKTDIWLCYSRFPTEESMDPSDVVILDLQNTRLGRPGIELAYFMCSSTSWHQRKYHLDELLQHYYNKFFEELANLGNQEQPWFSFEDLKKVCH
jgi:hypothetical protein